jgi:hypothetical protein
VPFLIVTCGVVSGGEVFLLSNGEDKTEVTRPRQAINLLARMVRRLLLVWMIQVRHVPVTTQRSVVDFKSSSNAFRPRICSCAGEVQKLSTGQEYEKSEDLYLGKACDPGHNADTSSGAMDLDCQAGYQPYREPFPRVE